MTAPPDPQELRRRAHDEYAKARACPLPALAEEHRKIADSFIREAEALETVPWRAAP